MITAIDINKILGITESFQFSKALMDILFDTEKKVRVFERFLEIEGDLSYEWFVNYFQEEQAARKTLKQDYTPLCLCKLLSELCSDREKVILDICAGIGGLSVGAWNKNRKRQIICEELSENSIAALLFNLSIRNIGGWVKQCDVLTGEIKKIYKLTSRERFSDIEVCSENACELEFEQAYLSVGTVISNPPYSLKFDRAEEFAEDKRFKEYGLPPKSKADYGFVLDGISRLKTGGKAFYILPHGVLFRGAREGEIRRRLIENNLLDAIIGLPDNLFLNTGIPVCVLVFAKDRENKDVLFIEASKEYKKEAKQNVLTEENINKIKNTYNNRSEIDKYSCRVSIGEIAENDFNLNIPRYVDTSEPKEIIDIDKLTDEMISTEREINETSRKLAEMIKDLKGDENWERNKGRIVSFFEREEPLSYWELSNKCSAFLDLRAVELNRRIIVRLYDVAAFERSKKGKIYPKGSILIQVSATRGQLRYMDKEGVVEDKYGVIMPKECITSKYLYYVLEETMPDFLRQYQTGLNINPDIFKHLKFGIHIDKGLQEEIVGLLEVMQEGVYAAQNRVEKDRQFKEYCLDGMFV